MSSTISTNRIINGLSYFSKYKNINIIDVPFVVPDHINRLTCPDWVQLVHHSEGMSYVGSAEQSFLYRHELNKLDRNELCYMAITPCIRDEAQDETHFKSFLKCELFSYDENEYKDFMLYATSFFSQYMDVVIEKTLDGFDIIGHKSGIELGSYGKRTVMINNQPLSFSYGTAFAEPRTSYVIKREKEL